MEAIADMRMIEDNDSKSSCLVAVGNVTINELITIKGVKYMQFLQEDGTMKPEILLPNREVVKEDGKSDWKPVLKVTKEMKAEIDRAVTENMRDRIVSDIHEPEIEVSVTPWRGAEGESQRE